MQNLPELRTTAHRRITRRALLGASGAAALAQNRRPPNIVFLFADDLGWGDLPSFGRRGRVAHGGWIQDGDPKTPNLDRMAAEGTRFTQFYVASPVCSPSRAGIMTGFFPARTGIHDYLGTPELNKRRGVSNSLDPKTGTLTRMLQKAGYATGHFGKWHLSSGPEAPTPEAYGIDRYDACLSGPDGRVRSSETIADRVIGFAEQHRAQPFYINAWLYDPHSPLHPTEEMMAPYADLSPKWGDQKGAMQVYYGVLTNMDRHIGRILDSLDRMGLAENTLFVFASDNGPESGLIPFTSHYGGAGSAGPFRGLKRSLYEGGIRTPFIARWKGATPAGRVNNDTVLSGVDFLPSFARLAGLDAPADVDGEDLSPSLQGENPRRRRALYWENRYPVYGHVLDRSPMLAMRDGDFKLLMNPDMSRVELYEIPRDPSEMNNAAAARKALVKEMSGRLLAWRRQLPKGFVDPDAGRNDYPWPGR
ncbi:MAG: sulfatase-like hydrolase/transferase [Bryobacteraceae bacterium]